MEKLVLGNHEKSSFCQRKLDRKIITFSPTAKLIILVVTIYKIP
jgi:hypothetical protein